MHAMLLDRAGAPLREAEVPDPVPGAHDVLLDVHCCGVCRTDLHVFDGELQRPKLPLVLGHEVVGTVVARGAAATRFELGARVGVPWLAFTCGECVQCRAGRENLCERGVFTGYTRDGGYATRTLADERYCFAIPPSYADAHAAPLLCAGLIGYRALRAAGNAQALGIYGFGAAAHIVAQVARFEGRRLFAFTRPNDDAAQTFARSLGAEWAGPSDGPPPEPLDAALIFAPVGALVPKALEAVRPGGTVVCAGIHMSDIPAMPYATLWGERVLRSVANLTREDGELFFEIARKTPLETHVETLPLTRANVALERLRRGEVQGALVLEPAR
ncbi:MAG TPA: zinc-dependent alcohol dehydrogenase family protein [Polyangiaceae bacterium]|nr:zinc-dependent alcohol dehydrogenase family protein [Polyangiaceae bacterium]